MPNKAKPRAKQGLLAADHSKRGRRFVTILDEGQKRVTLLDPWQHAVLVLCDGQRTATDIAELLKDGIGDGIDDEPVTLDGVTRCLRFFGREGLIDDAPNVLPAPGPRTLAGLQHAYREWHKDPVKSGRLLSGLLTPPFADAPPTFTPNLKPKVAVPDPAERGVPVSVGSTLVVDGPVDDDSRALTSVLDAGGHVPSPARGLDEEDLANVADLLAAVDLDLARDEGGGDVSVGGSLSADFKPHTDRDAVPPQAVIAARATGGVAELPSDGDLPTVEEVSGTGVAQIDAELTQGGQERAPLWTRRKTATGALLTDAPDARFRHRSVSEAALTPTLVGHAPADGEGPPVIISPERGPRSAGARVMATIGPEPSRPDEKAPSGQTIEDTLPVSRAHKAQGSD